MSDIPLFDPLEVLRTAEEEGFYNPKEVGLRGPAKLSIDIDEDYGFHNLYLEWELVATPKELEDAKKKRLALKEERENYKIGEDLLKEVVSCDSSKEQINIFLDSMNKKYAPGFFGNLKCNFRIEKTDTYKRLEEVIKERKYAAGAPKRAEWERLLKACEEKEKEKLLSGLTEEE